MADAVLMGAAKDVPGAGLQSWHARPHKADSADTCKVRGGRIVMYSLPFTDLGPQTLMESVVLRGLKRRAIQAW